MTSMMFPTDANEYVLYVLEEEETIRLVDHDEEKPSLPIKQSMKKKSSVRKSDQPGFSFSIRLLSFSVLVLLTASHSILAYQLLFQHRPAIRRYRVNTSHTTLPIYSKANVRGDPLGFVDPGQMWSLMKETTLPPFIAL